MKTDEIVQPGLPVVEEASDALWEAVSEGQPVLLVRGSRPAAVVIDYESWEEIEALLGE